MRFRFPLNAPTCWDCPHHHYVKDPDESIEVVIGGAYKPLRQYCHYCTETPRTKLLHAGADWTGRTPSWCPLRKEG